MGVSVILHLTCQLPEELRLEWGDRVRADHLRRLADILPRLYRTVANVLGVLEADGWDAHHVGVDVQCSHRAVRTVAAAERRLRKIGIDPATVEISDARKLLESIREREAAGQATGTGPDRRATVRGRARPARSVRPGGERRPPVESAVHWPGGRPGTPGRPALPSHK